MTTQAELTAARRVIVEVALALLDTVRAAGPQGAPAGPMYAAAMGCGISLDQFQRIMGALVAAGKLKHQGHVYYVVD